MEIEVKIVTPSGFKNYSISEGYLKSWLKSINESDDDRVSRKIEERKCKITSVLDGE
jgi:hypothetical protein